MALYPCGSANGGGGGGSTVVPNPTGEAVGELTSIGIDGNKYSISGGGGAYTTTVLFTNGASGDTTFQLSSAYTNFDAIAIYYSHSDGQDQYEDVRIYPTTFLNSVSSTDEVLGFTNDVWYYYFSVYSTTEFRYVKSNAGYITDIIGIKYGSNSGGGGGGTSDYEQLSNLPQINNTTLLGNKSAADLGLVGAETGKGLSSNDYTNADKAIVDGVTSALAGKADVSSVPTKTSDLTNDSGFITNTVNNLVNYYLKTETYSKTEVDSLLQTITTLDIQAVAQLPTTNISTTTIYLVPKQDPQVPDIKDEYINLDGTTSGWELIGNTQIDLSNYVTTSDLTTALQSYATKAYVGGLIGDLSALTTTDKSSCVAAINEVNGDVINLAAMISANPLSHNGIYTGRNLGTISSASDWATFRAKYGIADKSYKGLYLGDYVKVNDGTYNADWMVAGFNTETNKGGTNIPGECVSMIPRLGDGCGSSYMNSTKVTTGGYKDSYMNTTKLPDVATKLTTIFGSNLVTRDILVSKTVTNGYASDWEWISCKCSLLTSVQVYGSLSLENTGGAYFAGYNIGEGYEKLPVFNFIHSVQFSRSTFWLRGVTSATNFCNVNGNGSATCSIASTTHGVRPLICLS